MIKIALSTLIVLFATSAMAKNIRSEAKATLKRGPAQVTEVLPMIKAHADYRKLVQKYKKLGGSYSCSSIDETLTSKNYSVLPDIESKYSLVVVSCKVDPNDGMDAFGEKGLAVIAGNQIVSFSTAYYGQPD